MSHGPGPHEDPAGPLVLPDRDRRGWIDPDARERLPGWLHPVYDAAAGVRPEDLTTFLPPPTGGRRGAVLLLFGHGPQGPDLLIIERARHMRSHPGQPAFPGGAVDPDDPSIEAAALREAWEETGVDIAGVDVWGSLPALWLPPSGFVVSPVLAWWRDESHVWVTEPREVASVHRVPWADLMDPGRRVLVRHPSGYVGPGFQVRGLLVWGFTGNIIARLFAAAGLERPWEPSDVVDLPAWLT